MASHKLELVEELASQKLELVVVTASRKLELGVVVAMASQKLEMVAVMASCKLELVEELASQKLEQVVIIASQKLVQVEGTGGGDRFLNIGTGGGGDFFTTRTGGGDCFLEIGTSGGGDFFKTRICGGNGFSKTGTGGGNGFSKIGVNGGRASLKIGTSGGSGFLKMGMRDIYSAHCPPTLLLKCHKIQDVYAIVYETCGQYWPYIHHYIIVAIVLMQITMIGLFGLKSMPAASISIIPLLLLTLMFNEYWKKRFLPTFHHYSIQNAVEHDELDSKSSQMEVNYEDILCDMFLCDKSIFMENNDFENKYYQQNKFSVPGFFLTIVLRIGGEGRCGFLRIGMDGGSDFPKPGN
ncbi:csc1-like protein [Quercus suber]|uniref:Csc1-like protein n=1 Tax=Quercus suber TaxID=58331 RepID=A0AAW0L9I9_QUESU